MKKKKQKKTRTHTHNEPWKNAFWFSRKRKRTNHKFTCIRSWQRHKNRIEKKKQIAGSRAIRRRIGQHSHAAMPFSLHIVAVCRFFPFFLSFTILFLIGNCRRFCALFSKTAVHRYTLTVRTHTHFLGTIYGRSFAQSRPCIL